MLVACGTAIIALSVVGLVFSASLEDKYNKSKCAVYLVLNEALNGTSDKYTPGYTWLGSSVAEEIGNNLLAKIQSNEQQLNDISQPAITNDYTNAQNFISVTSTHFDGADTVTDPNTGDPLQLDILRKKNAGSKYAFLEMLEGEVEAFKGETTEMLRGLQEGAAELQKSNTIQDLKDALSKIGEFNEEIVDVKGNIYDYIDKPKKGIKAARIGLIAYYSIVIGVTFLTGAGTVAYICGGGKCLRCIGNLGCALLGVFVALGFVAAAVLFPVAVVVIEGCELIEVERLKEERGIVPEEAWEQVEICFGGDGDLYTGKGFKGSLEPVFKTVDGLNSVATIYDDSTGTMKYPAADSLLKELAEIRSRKPYKASASAFPSEKLDLGFVPRNDVIVWSGCAGGESPVTKAYLEQPDGICISLTSCSLSILGDVNNRYSSYPSFSSKLVSYIIFVNEVKTKISELIALIERGSGTSYYDAMDQDTQTTGIKDLMAKSNSIGDFDQTVEELKNATYGLKDGLNCTFMQESFGRVHSAVCGDFNQQLTATALFVGVISAISFVFIFVMVCASRNFYKKKSGARNKEKSELKEEKITPASVNRLEEDDL